MWEKEASWVLFPSAGLPRQRQHVPRQEQASVLRHLLHAARLTSCSSGPGAPGTAPMGHLGPMAAICPGRAETVYVTTAVQDPCMSHSVWVVAWGAAVMRTVAEECIGAAEEQHWVSPTFLSG